MSLKRRRHLPGRERRHSSWIKFPSGFLMTVKCVRYGMMKMQNGGFQRSISSVFCATVMTMKGTGITGNI